MKHIQTIPKLPIPAPQPKTFCTGLNLLIYYAKKNVSILQNSVRVACHRTFTSLQQCDVVVLRSQLTSSF